MKLVISDVGEGGATFRADAAKIPYSSCQIEIDLPDTEAREWLTRQADADALEQQLAELYHKAGGR